QRLRIYCFCTTHFSATVLMIATGDLPAYNVAANHLEERPEGGAETSMGQPCAVRAGRRTFLICSNPVARESDTLLRAPAVT
ncbi:MAG: hypothetical protein K5930_04230, partial [Treponemataceae bacterium]|nr:hypothetical protein [Treponemataceae bacterium]